MIILEFIKTHKFIVRKVTSMRKFMSILLAALMLSAAFTVGASAEELLIAPAPDTTAETVRPDLFLTKISPDQKKTEGKVWGETTTDGADGFEAFELVNTSGAPLNLYDYAMFYNGNATTHEKFGIMIELTPFKAGNYLDGSTTTWDGMPTNPDEFVLDAGEVIVVWATTNDSKGYTMDDFRSFWGITEGIRTIAWDGNSAAADKGGHDKNFNLKNSANGTYGITKYSDALIEGTSLFAEGESWSTVSYAAGSFAEKSVANAIIGFLPVKGEAAAAVIGHLEGAAFGILTEEQKAAIVDWMVDDAAVSAAAEAADAAIAAAVEAADAELTAALEAAVDADAAAAAAEAANAAIAAAADEAVAAAAEAITAAAANADETVVADDMAAVEAAAAEAVAEAEADIAAALAEAEAEIAAIEKENRARELAMVASLIRALAPIGPLA